MSDFQTIKLKSGVCSHPQNSGDGGIDVNLPNI